MMSEVAAGWSPTGRTSCGARGS